MPSFLEELAHLPWWVSVVVAALVYLGLATVLPALMGGSTIAEVVSDLAWLIAAILLIPGVISAIRVWRGQRMLDANKTKEEFRSLGWEAFEELVEAHYRRLGFRVRRDPGSGPDEGVDVWLSKPSGETYLVQCKQWRSNRVGVKVVRELLGVVAARHATGGIVVTSGAFTREAEEFAKDVALELIDGDRLQAMMGDLIDQDGAGHERDDQSEAMLCPRCGAALILRTAKRGANRGSTFYGCSSFPRCRFKRPV